MSDRAKIVQFYIAFYDRAPDPTGLHFWQGACDGGLSLAAIADLFVPQAESINTYPFLGNPTEEGIRTFLQAVYENLFNRDLDNAGETFWTDQILKSIAGDPEGLSIGEVVLSIICGAQGNDIISLANKTTVALDFHDQAAQVPDYVQTDEATAASKLALGVVGHTEFSVFQGQVLNENYFEDLTSGLTQFVPGDFNPLIPVGEAGLDEVQANGLILGSQQDPTVAVLADGRIVSVYEENFNSDDVAFQIRNADGSLSIPDISVSGTLPYIRFDLTIGDPKIAALPDGGFLIFADISFPDEPNGLYSLRFDSQGALQGDPALVASYDEFNYFDGFDITYLPTGNVLYTFSADPEDLDFEDVFTKVLTPEGVTVVDTQIVNENDGTNDDEQDPAAASLPDGTTLIVYHTRESDFDGDDGAVMGRLFDRDGVAVDDPFVINQITNSEQRAPVVAALGEDRFVVVFESQSGAFGEDDTGIVAVILDEDGDAEEDEFQINVSTAGDKRGPQVVALTDGNFAVAWATSADGFEIRARVFEDDGAPVSGEIMVNTFSDGFQSDPHLAATEDGFVVTWENNAGGETPEDPFGNGVRMAAFDQDGARVQLPDVPNPNVPVLMTEEFQVNNEVFAQQSDPGVVGLADGRSVFSYFDDESGGTLFEIRDANGLPLTDEMVALQSDVMAAQNDLPEARDVEMFATPDGGFVMAGTVRFNDTLGAGVRMQIFDSDLASSDIIEVSIGGLPGDNEGAEVTVGADGTIYVGWTFTKNGVSTMMLRTFAADGTPESGEISPHLLQPNGGIDLDALSVSSDGNILLIGEGDDLASGTSGNDLFMVLLEPDFTPISTGLLPLIPANHTGNQSGVTAAPLVAGKFLIAFGGNPAPGDFSVNGVSGIILNADGTRMGDQFLINTTQSGNQSAPDATVLSDGRVLVTWDGPGDGTTSGTDIVGRIFDPEDGSPDGDELLLNSLEAGNQLTPDVAAVGDGIVLAWLSDPDFGGPIPADIKGAVFDENFDPILTPLVLPSTAEAFLSVDDLVALQQGVLPGALAFTGLFQELSSGGSLTPGNPDVLVYQPGGDLNLALGEEGTELFGYRITNGTDTVNVVGSFTLQGFEDYVI